MVAQNRYASKGCKSELQITKIWSSASREKKIRTNYRNLLATSSLWNRLSTTSWYRNAIIWREKRVEKDIRKEAFFPSYTRTQTMVRFGRHCDMAETLQMSYDLIKGCAAKLTSDLRHLTSFSNLESISPKCKFVAVSRRKKHWGGGLDSLRNHAKLLSMWKSNFEKIFIFRRWKKKGSREKLNFLIMTV